MINIAIIGFGYWGPNLVRNFLSLPEISLVKICDTKSEKKALVEKSYPYISFTSEPNNILQDPSIDAIIIATPVHTHYALAKDALENGKHVLIEKPITTNSNQASELIELAKRKGKLIMIDHTFLYTGAVQKIKEELEKGAIGKINYYDSTRTNLGIFQPDVNVIWDLAAHDLSILFYINSERPVSVNATGICHTKNNIENIGYLTLNYNSNFIAHFHCSWSSPLKIRQILIGGDKKMILYNDMEPTEKIKIYDTQYGHKTEEDKKQILVDYRISDIFIPKLETKEALLGAAEDFIKCLTTKSEPRSSATLGIEIVKVLEAAEQSIKNKGKEVKINF